MGRRVDPAAAMESSRVAVEEREVWHRRVELGQSIARIAADMGISQSTVSRRHRSGLDRYRATTAETTVADWRDGQVAQLDRSIERAEVMIKACVEEVVDEDTGIVRHIIDHAAIARYETIRLQAIDRKAKLLGTYAVEKVEVTGTVTHVDARDLELAAMLGVADEVESEATS